MRAFILLALVAVAAASQTYNGKYDGYCQYDGIYYRDEKSFILCSNGNSYEQWCAPGTENSPSEKYNHGDGYGYRDFCDVNLVDDGYTLKNKHNSYEKDSYKEDSYDKKDYGYERKDYGYGYDRKDYGYEEPKYEEPKYEEPKYEEPKYEEPKKSYGYNRRDYGYDQKDYGYEEPKYEEPKYEEPKKSYNTEASYGQTYHGKYNGYCQYDGLYYRDEKSFIFCSNGNSYEQYCAPGTRNSPYQKFSHGDNYSTRDFCDVNLVDYGYAAAKYTVKKYNRRQGTYY